MIWLFQLFLFLEKDVSSFPIKPIFSLASHQRPGTFYSGYSSGKQNRPYFNAVLPGRQTPVLHLPPSCTCSNGCVGVWEPLLHPQDAAYLLPYLKQHSRVCIRIVSQR